MVWVLAFLWAAGVQADYRVPLQPPGAAKSKAMRVEVGQRVEIILEARGNGGREVTFILRDAPKRGKLSKLEKIQAGKARVVYTHNARKGIGVDSFRYAIQMSGGPVSAAGTVTIEAVDRGPRLEFPMLLDFGHVTLGQQSEQVIELVNTGGGIISGGVSVEGPFQIVEEAFFNLGPRGKSNIRVRFTPTAPGEYTGSAVVGAVGGGHIELMGVCSVPFSAGPDTGDLVCDANGIRAARFAIRSSTEDELVCLLSYEGAVAGPPQVKMSPLDTATFDVWAKESEVAGGSGKVIVQSGGFTKELTLNIAPLGPRLKVGPVSKIDLGEVRMGKEAAAEFWIENSGGEPGVVKILAPELILEPAGADLTIPPGDRLSLRAKWSDANGGESNRRVEILSAGAPAPMTVDLKARFLAAAQAVPVSQTLVNVQAEPAADEPEAAVDRIRRIEVTQRTQTKLVLKWEVPQGAKGYVTELRVFEIVDGQGKPVWKVVQPDGLEIKDGFAHLQLKDLYPATPYRFRIRVKDALDRLTAPSPEVDITTLAPKRWTIPWTGITIAILLMVAGWLVYLKKRGG